LAPVSSAADAFPQMPRQNVSCSPVLIAMSITLQQEHCPAEAVLQVSSRYLPVCACESSEAGRRAASTATAFCRRRASLPRRARCSGGQGRSACSSVVLLVHDDEPRFTTGPEWRCARLWRAACGGDEFVEAVAALAVAHPAVDHGNHVAERLLNGRWLRVSEISAQG